jgi:outer membrane protein TolC
MDFSLVQPLLQGAGFHVNMAPIVIARIDTERSFFQMKDSMQSMVRGVIEAYWAVVFARTDVWARQQQVQQGLEAFQYAEAQRKVGRGDIREVAQARVSLANFRAGLIAAQANLLQREAALRNILGLPPYDGSQLLPVTPPTNQRLDVDWNAILRLAEEHRPDLIELKLILEADHQRLLMARNQALPQLDLRGLYRWNGLEGRTPTRAEISTGPEDFTGWELGVNFSVPLGLRQGRAGLRQQELILARDRADLDQGLHNASHALATSYRAVIQYYEQYLAFREAREAAQVNLEYRIADRRAGRPTLYLNVLQAITDWGNAVSAEAQALTQYNVELSNLEQQTGTILETHGIRFLEERYGSIGPLGRAFDDRCYPRGARPSPNADCYPSGSAPAEDFFHLQPPEAK